MQRKRKTLKPNILPPKPAKGQFIDVDTITKNNTDRIRDCAKTLMRKHEHLFDKKIPNRMIFVTEQLKREDLDIPQIFDFPDKIYYAIFHVDNTWFIRIMCGYRMLIEAGYDKI